MSLTACSGFSCRNHHFRKRTLSDATQPDKLLQQDHYMLRNMLAHCSYKIRFDRETDDCTLITYSMANPNQQLYQQQEQVAYPPEVVNGYPAPVDHGASTQHPPPAAEGYPLESCPPEPQADLPPAYATHKQEPPPAYDSEADQFAYNFQPQPAANSATIVHVVESLPTAIASPVSSRREDHSRTAACALVFSLCTLIVCGGSVICLCLSIPALILSIKALTCRGREQKNSARTSICINVIVVVCTVVVLVAVVTPVAVSTNAGTTSDGTSGAGNSYSSRTRYCPSYYSSTYRTYCVASQTLAIRGICQGRI